MSLPIWLIHISDFKKDFLQLKSEEEFRGNWSQLKTGKSNKIEERAIFKKFSYNN